MEKVMNKCVICNKEIKTDSQFIKDRWYHNKCIESLQENYERIYNENCILRERIEYLERSNDRREDEILSLRQELYGQGDE